MPVKLLQIKGFMALGQPNSVAPTLPPVYYKDTTESNEIGQHTDWYGGETRDTANEPVGFRCY